MKFLLRFIGSCFIILCVNACATYNAQYAEENTNEEVFPSEETIDKIFYLIGDAGLSSENDLSDGLKAFQDYISGRNTKNDFAIFLGDNIYPAGMPDKNQKGRLQAENGLNAQIKAVKDFSGKVVFIPGNHDWYANGLKGLKREEKYIEEALGKNTFLPENGCPLESVDIGETIQLIIVDTQWYLENWNHNPTINDDCEIKTRERLFEEIESELKKAQNKTVVFAMHHPMYTNGTHGGHFAASKHLFPFQKKIPLPVLGSLITQIRTQGGVSVQDRYNERYNELMRRLETIAFDANNVVFVSGHEHNLQYIESNAIRQIVSGSGSKESPVTIDRNGLFSYGKQGFAELIVYKDGSSWVKMYGVENGKAKRLFQKKVLEPSKTFNDSNLPNSFPEEVAVSIYSKEQTNKSGFFETIWGDRYRTIYGTNIKAKVALLDTLYGGLEVLRKGGGHQTRSLRLKTKDGRELNMRALRKSATQYLQSVLFKDTYVEDEFERTAVEELVQDFYTAAHPYAFMAIPDLSHAAQIFHTNPKLLYVPKQKALGQYNTEYGDELYMIEERPEKNHTDTRNFGYADDIESTYDIIEKVRDDEKYKIDENDFIRARLFDMLVGDWDRHQDQWRWAQFDAENGGKIYRPIPRDRDQVFSNFDGVLLDVMKVVSGSTKQLQVYDSELKDIKWINSAGIKLDRILIQKANEADWLKEAQFLQENITDAVIDEAFSKVPKEVRDASLEEIKRNLKGRKSNLQDIARRYYKHLNELVILTGTDKDDYIEITRINDKETHVKISRIKDGKKADVLVNKTFNKDVTKEIWIYGLDDKDVFEVSGKAQHLIYTRLIGGQENDTYIIKNGRRVAVYDHKSKKNTIQENHGAKVKFTDIYNLNLFDYQKNIVKTSAITPSFGFNPDDGFKLGATYVKTVKGFQRNPFSKQHRLKGGYFFATKGFELNYEGTFANIFQDWNLHVAGRFTSENFTNNFFGYGNETINNDDNLGLDYNRVKTGIYALNVGVLKMGNFGSNYGVKAIFEGIEIEDTPNRFISNFMPIINGDFYKRRFFGGLEAVYNYKSFDHSINPTKGMTFLFNLGGKTEFKETKNTYGYINSELGFYNALSKNKKLVLKTDVRTQLRFGDDLVFYQAANIGGNNGMRGYRTERFTGKNALTGSADLRYSFPTFKTSVLPLQIGVFAGTDVGRVWYKGDFSKKWHNDYGGGFWVTAAESLSGTFNLFNGAEGLRFSFGFGLNF
ncbi:metallophosphoesterase [Flavobacteriaceae bacterium XHP0103]|uniref:metallophosphoesterase n=1 Tax=Marixanthotalea marina TaxID=2844359 RepID=UPI002989AFF7|nr:metallophosphoesterase [Marixanthotalea marina]MBU3821084.1 metallophosphoesterase [Marixanthotalea marina]